MKASKIPKTTTMRSLGCEGYTIVGPLHGNENLIICFDEEARPHLFKRLSNEDEINRVHCFHLQQFRHPFVTSFQFRSRGGIAAMIMPIFPSTLHSLTLDQRHTEIFGKLISQISQALEALHAIQFCHMDIKPSNIAIDNEGNFVLIDLGSVAPIGEPTESTDLYLPSEDIGTYDGRFIATEKRDWLMFAMTIYSKLNSRSWDGQYRVSSNQLITYLQNFEFANSLVFKINPT
jgi:serine/threonine protein kinase